MAKVIGIAIQKGGAGKSTTVYELASILSEQYGRRLLAVDMDPQGTLTNFTGTKKQAMSYDMLQGKDWKPIRPDGHSFDLVPSGIELASAELVLTKHPTWGRLLAESLDTVRDDYDYILLDAPPSLGLLTSNVVLASDGLIIPVQTEEESAIGMSLLLETIREITRRVPPLIAVIPTRYNAQSNYHKDILASLQTEYGDIVTRPVKQSIRFPESTTMHTPIIRYERELAAPYNELAERVERWAGRG